jgi:TP901 family phage tail tape measure protein
MNSGLSAMGAEALQVGKEIDAATDSIERQNEALRDQEAFESKIKQFLGMTGAVELLRRAMTNAFKTIKELDAAMAEMAVVTDIDISGYWDQLPEYTNRANALGLTIKDVYQADTLFYQQGLKTNEVIELSTQTMKMARVAGLDTAEATDRMTAALRGFNMELNEANAQKIADVYSELAAVTASDVDEISSAMTKTASIAASAGMEFETTAAFLSQIIETTRESAETAGTAMKTVIARFQELKKDPAEIGEVDGEIVDANKIETALRAVGVSLRDASG